MDGQQAIFQPGHIDVHAGRLLHHIIREYYQSPLTSQPHIFLLESYEKMAPRTPAWKDDPQGESRVLTALQLFADSKAARFRQVDLEVACKTRIREVLFVGRADLIYQSDELPGVYGILEFKLNDVEVKAQDAEERFLQCILYYMGLPEKYRRFCDLVSIYVFDTGQMLEAKIEQSIIDKTTRIVEATLLLSKGPDFPPTLNPFCSSCGYQTLCPAYSKRRTM